MTPRNPLRGEGVTQRCAFAPWIGPALENVHPFDLLAKNGSNSARLGGERELVALRTKALHQRVLVAAVARIDARMLATHVCRRGVRRAEIDHRGRLLGIEVPIE